MQNASSNPGVYNKMEIQETADAAIYNKGKTNARGTRRVRQYLWRQRDSQHFERNPAVLMQVVNPKYQLPLCFHRYCSTGWVASVVLLLLVSAMLGSVNQY